MIKHALQYYIFIFLAMRLTGTLCCYGQNNSNLTLDSVIRHAKLSIYKDPEKVIHIADSIYKKSSPVSAERIKALLLKCNGYTGKRDYEKSLELILEAQAIAQKIDNPDLQGLVLNRLAIIYQQLKIYDKALENIDKSNEFVDRHSVKDSLYIKAINDVVKGIIYKEQLSCELAINYFKKGIEKFKKINETKVMPNLSIAEYNKGMCYFESGNYTVAEQCYKSSIIYAHNVSANSLEAFAVKGLADLYSKQGKYITAIEHFNKALELSKNVGDLILEGGIYNGLAENYLLTGNASEFKKYRELFLKKQSALEDTERKAISDSVNELTESQKGNVNTLQTQFTIVFALLAGILFIALFFTIKYYFLSRKLVLTQKNKLDVILGTRNDHIAG